MATDGEYCVFWAVFGHFWHFLWPLLAVLGRLGHLRPFSQFLNVFGHCWPNFSNVRPFVAVLHADINFEPFWGICRGGALAFCASFAIFSHFMVVVPPEKIHKKSFSKTCKHTHKKKTKTNHHNSFNIY